MYMEEQGICFKFFTPGRGGTNGQGYHEGLVGTVELKEKENRLKRSREAMETLLQVITKRKARRRKR